MSPFEHFGLSRACSADPLCAAASFETRSKFLPVLVSSGSLILKGSVISADGEAMFSHAVQGMQPNLIARRWNFAFFASAPGAEKRTRAIQMEFETNVSRPPTAHPLEHALTGCDLSLRLQDEHGVDGKGKGRNKVNVGVVVFDKCVARVLLTIGLVRFGTDVDARPSSPPQQIVVPDVAASHGDGLGRQGDDDVRGDAPRARRRRIHGLHAPVARPLRVGRRQRPGRAD